MGTPGHLFQPGSGGGALTFVNSTTLSVEGQDITVTGLDGDIDGTYFCEVFIKAGSGAVDLDVVLVYPNGQSTNCASANFSYSGAGSGGTSQATLMLGYMGAIGKLFYSTFTFYPKTGNNRLLLAQAAEELAAGQAAQTTGGYYTETATNISSLAIHGAHALEFGAGSFMKVWKLGVS